MTMDQNMRQKAQDKTAPEPRQKRAYVAPRLTEYGSIAKLTQGSGATFTSDGAAMMMVG
jgi:hypothetical protein